MKFDSKLKMDERRKDLKKYYKYELTCKKCKLKYGSDEKDATKLCPDCLDNIKIG